MDPDVAMSVMRDAGHALDVRVDNAFALLGWLMVRGFPPAGHTRDSAYLEAVEFVNTHAPDGETRSEQ